MLITGGLTSACHILGTGEMGSQAPRHKTNGNLLLLKINMGAGHGGKSGRWNSLHELAEAYAFVVTQIPG
jgi:oligopeptidase B